MIKVSAHPGNGEKSDDPLSQASVNYDHSNMIQFSFRVLILRGQFLIGLWDVWWCRHVLLQKIENESSPDY